MTNEKPLLSLQESEATESNLKNIGDYLAFFNERLVIAKKGVFIRHCCIPDV